MTFLIFPYQNTTYFSVIYLFSLNGQIGIKILNVMGTDVSSPCGKTVGAWKWQLPPSSGGVKNGWNYAFTDPICLHVVHRDWLLCLYYFFYSNSCTLLYTL